MSNDLKVKFVKTEDNSTGLYCENTKDIFHSKTGALTESIQKFIEPANLLIKNKDNINVLDICFGIGYNSKSLLNNFPQKKITIDALEYNLDYVLISPFIVDGINDNNIRYFLLKEIEEKLKIDINTFKSIFLRYKNGNEDFFDEFISFFNESNSKIPYSDYIEAQNNCLLHNIYYKYISNREPSYINLYKYSDTSVNFHIGDARKTILECDKTYDLVFLDAFSSQKDPTLWTIDFLRLVSSRMHSDSIIVSYSKSTPFRSALKQLGFFVGKTFVDDIDMGTIASFNKKNILNDLSEYDLELLKTRSGITYKDPDLKLTSSEILSNRENEQKKSNLVSHTQFLKNYKK